MKMMDAVTRFEVIDWRDGEGRILTKYGTRVAYDIQDDGRTLKVFLVKDATVPEIKEMEHRE